MYMYMYQYMSCVSAMGIIVCVCVCKGFVQEVFRDILVKANSVHALYIYTYVVCYKYEDSWEYRSMVSL